MDITGKLIKIMPEVRGESQSGRPFVRGGFVIETDDTYPRQVAFTLFGEDRLAMLTGLAMNSMVQVTFSPESREYNERWYTDLRCIRVQSLMAGQMPAQSMAAQPTQPAQPAVPFAQPPASTAMPTDSSDDLPF
jgi:hypothetical protein